MGEESAGDKVLMVGGGGLMKGGIVVYEGPNFDRL